MNDKKKQLKLVLRTVALALVGLLLGLNIYMWNAQSLMGNALPMPLGFGTAVVLTGSMEPALSTDDLIFVQAGDRYAVGDIVVFQSGEMLVVHRIISMDGTTVVTKGDANNANDGEMDISAIKGRVTGHIPGVGGLVKLLKTPIVTIAMLGGALFLLERSFRKEKQKDDDQLELLKQEIRRLKAEQENEL